MKISQSMKNDQPFEENPDLLPAEKARLSLLKQILDQARIRYKMISHSETIDSAEQGVEYGFGRLAEMAPTFLLQADTGWICAIISGESRLLYKKIRKQLGVKDISLAKPEMVEKVTGAKVGYVSMINPGIPTIIDQRLTGLETVFGGCGVPRHTLSIRVIDLISITQAQVFDFTELKNQDNG